MTMSLSSLIAEDENIAVLEPMEEVAPSGGRLRDKFGRAITDLRVSVTDRCNYKCVYCRTGNEGAQYTELPIADYLRMVRLFVVAGGGEDPADGRRAAAAVGPGGDGARAGAMRTAYLPDGTYVGETGWDCRWILR